MTIDESWTSPLLVVASISPSISGDWSNTPMSNKRENPMKTKPTLDHRIVILMRDEQLSKLKESARWCRLNVSAYLRRLIEAVELDDKDK